MYANDYEIGFYNPPWLVVDYEVVYLKWVTLYVNSRMAINNGEDANSNTEVDNVVSIGVKFKIVLWNGEVNQKICAESLKRGNYVIKFSPICNFLAGKLDGNGNKLSLTNQSRLTNLMGFWENANSHPETSQYPPWRNFVSSNSKTFFVATQSAGWNYRCTTWN